MPPLRPFSERDDDVSAFTDEEFLRFEESWRQKFNFIVYAARACKNRDWNAWMALFTSKVIEQAWGTDEKTRSGGTVVQEIQQLISHAASSHGEDVWCDDLRSMERVLHVMAARWLVELSEDCPRRDIRTQSSYSWILWRKKIRKSLQAATGDGVIDWCKIWTIEAEVPGI